MMRFSLIDSTINWLCLELVSLYYYLDSFMLILHMLIDTDKFIAAFFRISYCLLGFDTLEFNRLPSSNNEICDGADFAGRFRYQLAMFGMCILIRLSGLLNTHIAYEIAI